VENKNIKFGLVASTIGFINPIPVGKLGQKAVCKSVFV